MKRFKFFSLVFVMGMLPFIWVACGSDDVIDQEDPETENPGQENPEQESTVVIKDVSAEDLIGHWQCVSQKWVEAGETSQSSYDVAEDEYYIQFNEDFTGQLDSGEDELMEIMHLQEFSWSVSNGIISFGTSKTDKWYIKEFSQDSMTLYWVDGEYNITCVFKRDAGGTYQPVLGPKITHIDYYRLRNGVTKEMENSYDFKYDSQRRIKEWKTTMYSGSGYVDIKTFNYVGNTITIGSDIYSIGENGYYKLDANSTSIRINGENITKITYTDDGYLNYIEYGDDALNEGTVNYKYDENGYSYTLESFYDKETAEYIYNVEFPNDASLNLIPLYTGGDYLSVLKIFDIAGKRAPFLAREYTYEHKRTYTHKQFIFSKDKEGRVIQIKESDDISPQVWDIYYEEYVDEPTNEPTTDEGTVADAVDLGLSVKWASWNLGATNSGEYGGLYAWGVPDAKPGYNVEGSRPDYLKEISGTEYDIARSKWGGSWRLPTSDEQNELRNKCKWELSRVNNIVGLKVIGPNGQSIFLPAAGYQNSVSMIDRGEIGYYWSGTRNKLDAGKPYPIYRFFTTMESQINWYWIANNYTSGTYDLNYCIAMSIRPVCD